MRYNLPGRHDVEVIDKEKLEVGKIYLGYMPMGNIFGAQWTGNMFRAVSGVIAPDLFYPEDGPEKLTFIPAVAMNAENETYSVKYTILYGDVPNSIVYFRRGMPYERALDCAQSIADGLGLKRGLPYGFHWLSVMDFEINEAIDVELEK